MQSYGLGEDLGNSQNKYSVVTNRDPHNPQCNVVPKQEKGPHYHNNPSPKKA